MVNFKVVLQLVLFAVVSIAALGGFEEAGAAVTGCGQVVRELSPCINYVIRGGAVPAQCCTGVRTLYGQAQTTADRQTVCSCIKSAAVGGSGYSNLNLGLAAGLPSKCGVSIPYKINPSTNCNTIK